MSSDKAPFEPAEHADGWSSTPPWYKSEHEAPAFSRLSTSSTLDSEYPLYPDRQPRLAVDTQMFEAHQSHLSHRFPTASHPGHPGNDMTHRYPTSNVDLMHQQTYSSYGGNTTYSQHQGRGYSLSHGLNDAATHPYTPDRMESTLAAPSSDGLIHSTNSSLATSARLANFAQVSGTLHQYACAKQRRSRHDPGGGSSPYGHTETLQIGAYHDDGLPGYHNMIEEPLPIASPHSSALYNAIMEVPAHAPHRQPTRPDPIQTEDTRYTTYRDESPGEQLQYPDESSQAEGSSSASTTPISPMPSPFTLTPLDKARNGPVRTEAPPLDRVKYKRGTPTKVACFFCRKRKIACGGPPEGSKDGACSLECYYPEAAQRGRRSPLPAGVPSEGFSMGFLYSDHS
ncbi:hypothetical protein EIP91_000283 [Steccherinum ochraceum]|uniref:Zn(2)-C6 fungal-type domain-containing protein n=1 Tax=Steccherinum ochraceum TaxID=92696 RepID=A0A4R0RK86_9APHY|nr:hypothetical protein EIP91_000283 [Steccherinum ochraceum]